LKDSVPVKFHEKHILVKFEIVCDHSTAPIGGVLEIKQCDFNGDAARARNLAGNSVDGGGLRRNRNMRSERYNEILFFLDLIGFVVINRPTQLDDVRPFLCLVGRGIFGGETRRFGIKD